jgi:predicted MPP superfamily phosphohydrolase
MRQISSFVIFISVILVLSFLINFYVLSRLCSLFGIKKGAAFWVILLYAGVSLVGASILQSSSGDIISRMVYTVSAGWLGVLWLLFVTLIVYEILRLFIKISPSSAGVLIVTLVGLVTLYSIINAHWVRIKSLTIPGPTDCNIVQLSDIHIGSVSANFVKRIIDKTNALNPDLVLITGDLVDNYNANTQKAVGLLKNLKAPVFFVTGNHERYVGPRRVKKSLTAANVKVLNNELADYGQIQIIGVDYNDSERNLERVIQGLKIDNSKFCILMYHRPIELKTLAKTGVNLVLSGHTHAGQIFPFNYIVGLFYPYLSGLHKYNNTYQYITSGTGTWGPRMRLGSRSEIVLLEIRKEIIDSLNQPGPAPTGQ